MTHPTPPELPQPPTKNPKAEEWAVKAQYEKQLALAGALYEATIEATAVARKRLEDRRDTDAAAEVLSVAAIQAAYVDVAKGSLDRSLKRAELHTGLVTAVGTLYGTVLGLKFSAAAGAQPLPARAIFPAVFLGIALVLGAAYVAGIRRKVIVINLLPSGSSGIVAEDRLRAFLDWTFSGALARAWALRSSVVSFGAGLALLPIGFLDLDGDQVAVAVGAAVGLVVLYAAIDFGFTLTQKETPAHGVSEPLSR